MSVSETHGTRERERQIEREREVCPLPGAATPVMRRVSECECVSESG